LIFFYDAEQKKINAELMQSHAEQKKINAELMQSTIKSLIPSTSNIKLAKIVADLNRTVGPSYE
jgi:hypothetical protein